MLKMENSNQNPVTNNPDNQPVNPPTIDSNNPITNNQVITTDPQAPQLVNPATSISPGQPIVSNASTTNANKPNSRPSKKLFILGLVLLVLIIGGVAFAYKSLGKKPTATNTKNTTSSTINSSSGSQPATFSCNTNSSDSTKTNYISTSGGFSAWFPTTPSSDQSVGPHILPGGSEIRTGTEWFYDVNGSGGIPGYEIDEYAIPTGSSFTASQIGSSFTSPSSLAPGISVICSGSTTISGVTSYKYALHLPASSDSETPNSYQYGLIVPNKGNVYVITMSTTQLNDPNATKFLNSFSFNN